MKRWPVGVLRVLPLSFAAFLAERDRCRERTHRSNDRVLRDAFIENTDRRYDHVSQELERAIAGQPLEPAVATVMALRLSGSARESERPGRSGAAPIMAATLRGDLGFLETMPFTGRKTYRAVMKKATMARAVQVTRRLTRPARSLKRLTKRVKKRLEKHSTRQLHFHPLQIACDLYVYGLVHVRDASDCPLAIGSERGMKWVRQEYPGVTVRSLAELLERPAHSVQTGLCGYDKYRRYTRDGIPAKKLRSYTTRRDAPAV
jgi:hypothetical protein